MNHYLNRPYAQRIRRAYITGNITHREAQSRILLYFWRWN